MSKFRFLLLDAGPIIRLFRLGIWDTLIKRCEVTITRTVVEEAVHTGELGSHGYIKFPFEQAAEEGLITIVDMDLGSVRTFLKNTGVYEKYAIDPGEAETLAFMASSSENFRVCTADGPVFSALGFLGKAEKGTSLEELLQKVGLKPSSQLEWRFTKRFREKYTKLGKVDLIQGQGFAT